MSLASAKFGSRVVRYEDLLVDPLSQLREVTSKIVPLDEERLKAAVQGSSTRVSYRLVCEAKRRES
jgi:hypothetical protein